MTSTTITVTTMSAIRAYGVPADGHTDLTDTATGEIFVDRTTGIQNIRDKYPDYEVLRWQGMSSISDDRQQGAILVIDKSASAEDVLFSAGAIFAKARAAERHAAGAVYTAIEHAFHAGMSEVQIAKIAGVDRMTVRRALGKL